MAQQSPRLHVLNDKEHGDWLMDYNLNAMCYYQSALDLLLPVKLHPEMDGFELVLGKAHYFFCAHVTPFNRTTSAIISQNKFLTNTLLSQHSIPLSKAKIIHFDEYQKVALEKLLAPLRFPLVIKPLDRGLAEGVICNIKNSEQLKELLDIYLPRYSSLLLEEFHAHLKSYRVLIFNEHVMGVLEIIPPHIFGDGQHTVHELIALTNQQRPPINLFLNLGPIQMDEECHIQLKEQGLHLDAIPPPGQKIVLGYAGRGGTYAAIDPKIDKKNKKLMIRVAKLSGLNFVGIDVECEDIYTSIAHSNGVIVETNHNPNIKMHEQPLQGTANRVSLKMMRSLIYRHPLAYLGVLYQHEKTRFYLCAVTVLLCGLVYCLFSKFNLLTQ